MIRVQATTLNSWQRGVRSAAVFDARLLLQLSLLSIQHNARNASIGTASVILACWPLRQLRLLRCTRVALRGKRASVVLMLLANGLRRRNKKFSVTVSMTESAMQPLAGLKH